MATRNKQEKQKHTRGGRTEAGGSFLFRFRFLRRDGEHPTQLLLQAGLHARGSCVIFLEDASRGDPRNHWVPYNAIDSLKHQLKKSFLTTQRHTRYYLTKRSSAGVTFPVRNPFRTPKISHSNLKCFGPETKTISLDSGKEIEP